MNNTLHTPAPWKHDPTWGIIKYGKTEICALHSGNIANAHLISAAPDLLSTLQDICAMIVSPNDTRADILAHARAAIAKAEGK
jgi:hypothetical protein